MLLVLLLSLPALASASVAQGPSNPAAPALLPVVEPITPVPWSVGCTPPGSGDWVITAAVVCSAEDLVVAGNVTVDAGGSLELDDTTLSFDSPAADGYDLQALPGSSLFINDSRLHSTSDATYFSLLVETGVVFSIRDSEVIGAGWNDLENYDTAVAGQALTEYNRYLWMQAPGTDRTFTSGDGIEIRSTPLEFTGNTFENYTHLRLYADDVVADGNTFRQFKHEGLAFLDDLSDIVVTNNTFEDSFRMNRAIHALVFYTNITRIEIADNTFSWLTSSILIADRGPWWPGYDVQIHHNDFRNVIFGYRGRVDGGEIHHNTFDGIMQAMSIDSTVNMVIHDNVMRNITFQQEVDDVIDQAYYDEVDGRGLLPNLAYWMWGFYCSKFIVNLSWYTRDVVVRDNVFADAPPYTLALNTDQAQGLARVTIEDNLFENIGTYIPAGYPVRRDTTGYNVISNLTPLSGASIMLEGSDEVTIQGNTFRNVVNGVTTSGPDALGNFGTFTVNDNLLLGAGPTTWNEQRLGGAWWGGAFPVTEWGIGVGTSMHYNINGVYNWSAWIGTTYEADGTQRIDNNTLAHFRYPIVIDYRRDQASAPLMGVKGAVVEDNLIVDYEEIKTVATAPNTVTLLDNVLVPDHPPALGAPVLAAPHEWTSTADVVLLPETITLPPVSVTNVTSWSSLVASPVGGAAIVLSVSGDFGATWQAVPAGGDLSGLALGQDLLLRLNVTGDPWPRGTAVVRTTALTLGWQTNDGPLLQALSNVTGAKWEEVVLAAAVSDIDADTLSLQWSQVGGPPVELQGAQGPVVSFVPQLSGLYELLLEVTDGTQSVNGTVNVSVANGAPTISAAAPAVALTGQEIPLNGSGTDPDGDPLTFVWTQVSGPLVPLDNSSAPNTSFVALDGGTYRFSVEVFDNEALSSGAVLVETIVLAQPPQANLTVTPRQVVVGQEVTLDGSGSSDPDGMVVAYSFDFGDDAFTGWGDAATVTHTYGEEGTFGVLLQVRDDDDLVSAVALVAVEVSALPLGPQAVIEVSDLSPLVGEEVTFASYSVAGDSPLVRTTWTFPGEVQVVGQEVVEIVFTVAGAVVVTLTVEDELGLNSTASVGLIVRPPPNVPPEILSVTPPSPVTMLVGQQLRFSIIATDPEGAVLSYRWTVDGQRVGSANSSVNVTAAVVGTMTVDVTVEDGAGGVATHRWAVQVSPTVIIIDHIPRPLWMLLLPGVAFALAIAVVVAVYLAGRRHSAGRWPVGPSQGPPPPGAPPLYPPTSTAPPQPPSPPVAAAPVAPTDPEAIVEQPAAVGPADPPPLP